MCEWDRALGEQRVEQVDSVHDKRFTVYFHFANNVLLQTIS